MSTRNSNSVSSHELDTPGLTPVFTNLDKEPKPTRLPAVINFDPNNLPDVVIVGGTVDFAESGRFALANPSSTIPEFGEGADSPGSSVALLKSIVSSILVVSVVDDQEFDNLPIEADDGYHHWSPKSQPYAPADVLLQYLHDGWEINNRIVSEVFRCLSRQCVELYYFMLLRDGEFVTLPIVANPVASRLIREFSLTVIQVYDECEDSYHREASELISEQAVGLRV